MFLDEPPLYLPGKPLRKNDTGPVSVIILLPGEEKHYSQEDQTLVNRLMTALGIAEDNYGIQYVKGFERERLSSIAHENGTCIINMGVDWERIGFHIALAPYHARKLGEYYLVGSDIPSRLSKDPQLKKMLWGEL